MAKLNFDAGSVEPIGSFDPLPVGSYLVVIDATEKKDAKTGKGQYLQLTYNVVDGEYHGRKVFDRLNIVNENTQAQEIAQRALSAICRAVGVMHPTDSDQLKDIPFVVKVGIRAASGEFQASNIVKGYMRADGKPLTDTVPTSAPASAPSQKKKPWEK
jgi:hypothetical protein